MGHRSSGQVSVTVGSDSVSVAEIGNDVGDTACFTSPVPRAKMASGMALLPLKPSASKHSRKKCESSAELTRYSKTLQFSSLPS